MLKFIKRLFSKNVINKSDKLLSPIDRVAHKTETNALSNVKKKYSVYGIIDAGGFGVCAVCHWQGWEDAGWVLINIKDLEPFVVPNLDNVEFYYTYPNDIHKWYHELPSSLCKINTFYMNHGKLWANISIHDGRIINTSTEYLYDVNDPQFYGYRR